MNVVAVISMLHEEAEDHSVRRQFHGRPVLWWTLQRLARCQRTKRAVILCWEDQHADVRAAAGTAAVVCAKGHRSIVPAMEAVTAASRWRDGWRGGLLGTCEFDLGFHGPWIKQIMDDGQADAVLLVDPAAGLIDGMLLDRLIDHVGMKEAIEIGFLPAAPGFASALIKSAMIDRLAAAQAHPGRLLHYMPELPLREPLGGDGCAPVPTPVARTTERFKLDSTRQIARMERATAGVGNAVPQAVILSEAKNLDRSNGQTLRFAQGDIHALMECDSQSLVGLLTGRPLDALPRDVTVELTTRRATRPLFWAGRHAEIARPDMSRERAQRIWKQLAAADDVRVTLAGVGDPLLHQQFAAIVRDARDAGIRAIHVETDLREFNEVILTTLLDGSVDVVSVHIPAMTESTYQAVMGVDGMSRVLANIRDLAAGRSACRRGVPLIVPTFVRCTANAAEMEGWYDQWLRALSSAVVRGPSDCAGLIGDIGGVDVTPPQRVGCRRLVGRMTILSDGRAATCEEDVLGRQSVGDVDRTPIGEIWQRQLQAVRDVHRDGRWAELPACAKCREWHRP